ncbi:MAG: iron-containing alcohol dehydrogenase [Deltaproteobacteria bacterium]|nr:iron-containing alcohol dehydrogenase [Deltaproteobacteria bacterium]
MDEDQLPEAAEAAINDGALVYNPREVSYEDALGVYRKAF